LFQISSTTASSSFLTSDGFGFGFNLICFLTKGGFVLMALYVAAIIIIVCIIACNGFVAVYVYALARYPFGCLYEQF
jgi:hypothetical protein